MIEISYQKLKEDCKVLAEKIKTADRGYTSIYAIPRGGVPVGLYLSNELDIPLVKEPEKGSLIVDDLVDSGKTIDPYIKDQYDVAVLYRKPHSPEESSNLYIVETLDDWIEFPYEATNLDAEENFRRILEFLGEDPTREGLQETPKRYLKFMRQFLEKDDFNFTTFSSEGYDEMVVQKEIPFYSLCEHHIAPFFGTATVAYIPGDKIVGLSKLARTVRHYAANFQNQERITSQVAERLEKELNPLGVAVTLSARHFCMEMRGVKTHDVHTVTTKLIGAFKNKPDTKAEYMGHIKG